MAYSDDLAARMIQNFSDANSSQLQPHWGYADRILPCKNDAGSCAYLDVVYHSHDLSMLYTGIFWSCVGAILILWAFGRRLFPSARPDLAAAPAPAFPPADKPESQQEATAIGGAEKLRRSTASLLRRYLLPDFAPRLLGHVSRLQVLVMLILAGYLTVFTFVGIVYNKWITPVKNSPGVYNTRTSLGPFADRIGVLAYALTPLSVLLASRESLLSLLTGIPYQSFMFLHRWVGYIILIQSTVHTIGWVVVETRLYQPQPSVWNKLAAELYIQWGFVAWGLLILLWMLATPLGIKLTGYEFFRKAHYVLAMVYIGAIIGHWSNLQCFLIPGILLWFLDRLARATRTAMLHYQWIPARGSWAFESATASLTRWADNEEGDVVRLDFEHLQPPWAVGQHFYLCFTDLSIWQSHPFTPLNLPVADRFGRVRHSYVLRTKKGETAKLARIAAAKLTAAQAVDGNGGSTAAAAASPSASSSSSSSGAGAATTPIVLTGPYGVDILSGVSAWTNVLCVAGGTGITFVLPVLLALVRERPVPGRRLELVWAVRRAADVSWVEQELRELNAYGRGRDVKVNVYVTRDKDHSAAGKPDADATHVQEKGSRSTSCATWPPSRAAGIMHHYASDTEVPQARRPHLDQIVTDFVASLERDSSTVYASGPGGMIGDLRTVVARCNRPGRVWKGDGRSAVRLVCDDRLE